MSIVAFIQDEHSIKDIMKAQGFDRELDSTELVEVSRTASQTCLARRSLGEVGQAPPPIPKFISATEALDEIPAYDAFEPSPDDL